VAEFWKPHRGGDTVSQPWQPSVTGRDRPARLTGPGTTAEPGQGGQCAPVPAPGAVRYMSVDSRKQPDSQGRDGTPSRENATARDAGKTLVMGCFRW